jgi:signal transduction histidine kinase
VSRLPVIRAASACRAVVQSLPHAVVLLDERQRVVLANRAASALLRVPPQRLRGAAIGTLVPDDHLERLLGGRDDRRARMMEISLPPSGRARTPQTLNITAVRLPRVGTVGRGRRAETLRARREFRLLVLHDVSDKALLEQQLVDTEKQAAVGQLAAGIIHEVSNPLASLGSNLRFVREALAESPATEILDALDASLDHLDQMRQLLGTLSSFPSRRAPHFEPADLNDLVQRCVAFVARDAERRRLRVTTSFAAASLACEMDLRLIKQVLLNLLKNAMEATPAEGQIQVATAYRARHHDDPAAVVLAVADTGIGIEDTDLRRIFRPLFSTKPRGTGLGLSFCRQAVEEHGGEIRLASAGRGRGTVATVTLPVRQAQTEVGDTRTVASP